MPTALFLDIINERAPALPSAGSVAGEVNQVVSVLGEWEIHKIFFKLASVVGARRFRAIFEETCERWGVETADGSRMKTPGGLMLSIARKGAHLSEEEKRLVFKVKGHK